MNLVTVDVDHHREVPIGWESRNQYRERVRVHRASADWLDQYDWHHYVDLTSRNPLSELQLLRTFEYQSIRWLEKSAQKPVRWAVFAERGKIGGRCHLHALLYGTLSLAVDEIDHAWRLGLAEVRVYDAKKGATGYITRDVLDDAEWDVSRRMPPVLRGSIS